MSSQRQASVREPARAGISEELRRLRRSELSLEDYVEAQVERALEHLKGRMSEGDLQIVRDVLRDHIEMDPVVREMIRQATGRELPSRAAG